MLNDQPITKEYFCKRFADLCLRSGLEEFPKDDLSQQILLKSVTLTLDPTLPLTEKELNVKLRAWIHEITCFKKLDHDTLRRHLVDEGYLTRDKAGSCYQVAARQGRTPVFEPAIAQVNLQQVLEEAREESARRKREYLEKAAQQKKAKENQ